MAANDFNGKNDDPLVNHVEHSHDFSFATQVNPTETLSLDFDVAHDDVFSQTDLCYIFLPTASAPLPPGATNSGTCVPTADNNTATSNLFLGRGYYDAPSTFFSGALSYAPSHYFRFNGGMRLTELNGKAELLNPLMAPGALLSKTVSPFADLAVNIAPQWSWHGNWIHHGYGEGGGSGWYRAAQLSWRCRYSECEVRILNTDRATQLANASLLTVDLKQDPGDSFSPAGFKDVRQSNEQA